MVLRVYWLNLKLILLLYQTLQLNPFYNTLESTPMIRRLQCNSPTIHWDVFTTRSSIYCRGGGKLHLFRSDVKKIELIHLYIYFNKLMILDCSIDIISCSKVHFWCCIRCPSGISQFIYTYLLVKFLSKNHF